MALRKLPYGAAIRRCKDGAAGITSAFGVGFCNFDTKETKDKSQIGREIWR